MDYKAKGRLSPSSGDLAQLLGLIDVARARSTWSFRNDSGLLRVFDRSIELRGYAFDFLPPHDVTTRVNRTV